MAKLIPGNRHVHIWDPTAVGGHGRWEGDDREPPNRLVYLLDHRYIQRGLSWDRLKGAAAA